MKANRNFIDQGQSFWGYVRIISNIKGYSGKSKIKSFSKEEISTVLKAQKIGVSDKMLIDLEEYFAYRKSVLEDVVEPNLMDLDETSSAFKQLLSDFTRRFGEPKCPLPFNKQKGNKKNYAYFTCQINLLTEWAINDFKKNNGIQVHCNYDPRNLSYITTQDNTLGATMSRRFDGAIPGIKNPVSVWEIKEYYYTTTFGSRISDGVYETQLDGFEINDIEQQNSIRVNHSFLIDSHRTWWGMGKSYLCRLIDALNMGLVDHVFFGKEIYESWQDFVAESCKEQFF